MLLQPWMAEEGWGHPSLLPVSASYISLLCPWSCTCPHLSLSLTKPPVKVTLYWARPSHRAFVIPIIKNALLDFDVFGSILICFRVTGYLLGWRLNGDPIKGYPYNDVDVIFPKKGSPNKTGKVGINASCNYQNQ